MNKSKIFHIITHFDLGGAERVAINIGKSTSKDFEYHIFEVARGKSTFTKQMLTELQENNIQYHRSYISNKKIAIILFPFWFICCCFFNQPKIIHTHTEIPDLSIFLFSKVTKRLFPKIKYVRTIHNTQLWNDWGTVGRNIEPFFINNSANIAISESTKQSYQSKYKSEDIPIIYNGLEESKQQVFPNIKENKINILFAGRLEYQKGIDELINIVTTLKNDNRFHFHIIGNGSLQQKLYDSVNELQNVTLMDKIYNLAAYLSSFDYLFMPSNFEGLALMSIEASLNKVPAIINDCLGLGETLPKDWPLKATNNSLNDYYNIFNNKLMKYNREELVLDAYNYVQCRFSIKKMQKTYEKLYIDKLK